MDVCLSLGGNFSKPFGGPRQALLCQTDSLDPAVRSKLGLGFGLGSAPAPGAANRALAVGPDASAVPNAGSARGRCSWMGSARVPRAVVAVPARTSFHHHSSERLRRRRWSDEVSGGTPETTRQRRVLPDSNRIVLAACATGVFREGAENGTRGACAPQRPVPVAYRQPGSARPSALIRPSERLAQSGRLPCSEDFPSRRLTTA